MIIMRMIATRFSKRLTHVMARIIDGVDAKFFEQEIYLNHNAIAKKLFRLWIAMSGSGSVMHKVNG